jgi:preprotein translocase subunit SecA
VLNSVLKALFGTSSERAVKRLGPLVAQVRSHEARFSAMDDDELRAQTGVFKKQLAEGKTLDDIMPEAFAVVREAASRVVGLRPFDSQILGGIVLHQGCISEMVTGEGKTLVATLPIYLNALTGRGVHLVTVNDYLARRDREWMGPIYEFLGLTVGLIQHDMGTEEKQVGYRADITYGTNSEFGFDYLRDNMAVRPEQRVQRELNFAIVDEVDSILIDEARTPLIISGHPERSTEMYVKVDEAVRRLRKGDHFELEEKGKHVMLSEDGMMAVERLLGVDNLYTDDSLGVVHMVEQSLRSHHFYRKDVEYVVRDGEVLIVDDFTGRIMEGRRYSDGLHQAIEAKERVSVRQELQTMATISYQNFFKLYNKLAGMTGTAATEAAEFSHIYNLEVIQIPTNLPLIRRDMTDLVFATEKGKFRTVVDEIIEVHESGRPILVGTVSIEKSELVAQLLEEKGVEDFQVLNAKYHEREAAIVANAGKRDAITIATNMAGRGTDIKLGEGVRELGGLAIIGTERHESRRIDNQLRGRCGRQGDPGSTRFFLSLEDEVARLFGGDRVKKIIDWIGADQMDDEPLSQRMVTRSIERAQRQVEEYNFEVRKHLLDYDDVMNRQRMIVYEMRRDVLEDRDITGRLQDMFANILDDIVAEYAPQDQLPDEWDLDGLKIRFKQVFGFEPDLVGEDEVPQQLPDLLQDQVNAKYKSHEAAMADYMREEFAEQIGGDDSHIDFPKFARKRIHDYELMALLNAVDDRWIEHLYSMDYLRESVRLRAYGQRDPLVEYKTEGFELFEQMMKAVEENVVQTLFRVTDPEFFRSRKLAALQGRQAAKDDTVERLSRYQYVSADKQQDRSFSVYDTSRFQLAGQASVGDGEDGNGASREEPKVKREPIRVEVRIGRNDPCPCGSGKKYKKCCGTENL